MTIVVNVINLNSENICYHFNPEGFHFECFSVGLVRNAHKGALLSIGESCCMKDKPQ